MLSNLRRAIGYTAFAATVSALALGGAFAAGSHSGGHAGGHGHGDKAANEMLKGGHGHRHNFVFGAPGEAAQVKRTIEITMGDNYFEPEALQVKAGETIRLVVHNKGAFLHEFNLGTAAMHVEHQAQMATMMEHGMLTPTGIDHKMMKMDHGGGHAMKHDHANSVLLEPGKSGEIIWTFAAASDIEFACNVPGHYEAGMMGPLKIENVGGAGADS